MEEEYKIYRELSLDFNKKNRGLFSRTKMFYVTLLIVLLIPQIILLFTKKTYEYAEDLDNLPEPLQTPASGGVVMKVHGVDVQIDFLAKYDISGRIISTKDYAGTDIEKGLGPRDFVIGRGKMGRQEIVDKFHWNDMKNRIIYAYVPFENVDRFDKEFDGDVMHGNRGTCGISYSNNHPIPANKKVKLLMKKIKEGDYVRLQGYLVYAKWETKNGRYWWGPSSLVRTDRGDHSCEIIYVTDVSWLKEK